MKDHDRTRALLGFLPWAINENYAKLQSAFSSLKTFEELGTPEEIANARQNALYVMGVMGHYVGDAAQPLHTTKHHHGWVGENPRRYATNYGFHAWIDGGFIGRTGLKTETMLSQVRPARSLWAGKTNAPGTGSFPLILDYVGEQHQLVEPLYQMDKERKLSRTGRPWRRGKSSSAANCSRPARCWGTCGFRPGRRRRRTSFCTANC